MNCNDILIYLIFFDILGIHIGKATAAINDAIKIYHERTCVRFVQHTDEDDYVRFFAGNG